MLAHRLSVHRLIVLLARLCLSALAAVAFLVGPARCQSLVTSRAAMPGGDSVDWTALGDHASRVSNPFSLLSSQGTPVIISQTGHGQGSQSGGLFATLRQAGSVQAEGTLNGNFAPGDTVLDALDGGTVSLNFPRGVYGGGAQLAVPTATTSGAGVFMVQVQAFGRDNALLASFTRSGTFSAKGDNSAPFFGIVDPSPDIYRISYTGITPHYSLFLNRLAVAIAPTATVGGHTHLLWTHPTGLASVWNVAPDGSYTYTLYGPYAGWSATNLSIGPDGNVRLLWTHAGGLASLWNLTDAHPDQTCHVYGPFACWAAASLAVGPDNVPHLLWTHPSGQASVWNVGPDGGYTYTLYGPCAGWAASSLSVGPDGNVRLLWTHAGGLASLWNLADAQPAQTCHVYGPFAGWSAVSLAVGPDNAPHLLWTHPTGLASVWNVAPDGGYTYTLYGPYAGWAATNLSVGPDGAVRLLWTHAGGLASLWNLADAQPAQTCHVYGPFAGWSAVSLAAGP